MPRELINVSDEVKRLLDWTKEKLGHPEWSYGFTIKYLIETLVEDEKDIIMKRLKEIRAWCLTTTELREYEKFFELVRLAIALDIPATELEKSLKKVIKEKTGTKNLK